MNTISESVSPWRAGTELAVIPEAQPDRGMPPGGDTAEEDEFQVFGEDGFTFLDFLDIINPLQHIPVISTLYREFTGDTIDPGSNVIGSTLFFGPVGTVVSLANVFIEDATGKDMTEHAMALFRGEDSDVPEVASAEAETVIDIGAQSFAAKGPETNAAQGAEPEAVDPVTAWAMAETTFRRTAAEKSRMSLGGDIPGDADPIPHPERAEAPVAPAAPKDNNGENTIRVVSDASGLVWASSVLQETKQSARLYAAQAYDRPDQKDNRTGKPLNRPVPAGAVAYRGGWFSDTMLTALESYKSGASLAGNERPATVDLRP